MLLLDGHQIAYATILEYLSAMSETEISVENARILVLDTIRANVNKFKRSYGPNIVLAFDDEAYWRKERFPHYKFSRRKLREKSQFDWSSINTALNTIREEFYMFLPYQVLSIGRCEADDIIATLTLQRHTHEKVLIVSGDKDFKQLHIHSNIAQYAPVQKTHVTPEVNAHVDLKRLIIKGDTGDGIPNILSPDNSFVDGIRQKPIFEKKLAEWVNQTPEEFCTTPEMLRNWHRNKGLIDFKEIPQDVTDMIMAQYAIKTDASKNLFLDYLSSKRLKQFVEVLDEF